MSSPTPTTSFEEGNKRLLALVVVLEAAHQVETALDKPGYRQSRWVHRCGTPACALGHWAANNADRWRQATDDTSPTLIQEQRSGVSAAMIEFGLTYEEAEVIFGAYGCDTPDSALGAAAYIRNFVERRIARKAERDANAAAEAAALERAAAEKAEREKAAAFKLEAAKKSIGRKRLLALSHILDQADALHNLLAEPSYCQREFKHDCGTPACALAHWAAYSGNRHRWSYASGNTLPTLNAGSNGSPFQDAMSDFEINYDQATELFDKYGCGGAMTAKQAAEYIRKFVDKKWGPVA